MATNPALSWILDQSCNVFSPTETVTRGRTDITLSKSTGVACHVQALTPDEAPRGFGYEEMGDYQCFFHSTEDVEQGDLVQPTNGPYSGKNFWVRAIHKSETVYAEHAMANLELTQQSTSEFA